jgi:hypothetical protein
MLLSLTRHCGHAISFEKQTRQLILMYCIAPAPCTPCTHEHQCVVCVCVWGHACVQHDGCTPMAKRSHSSKRQGWPVGPGPNCHRGGLIFDARAPVSCRTSRLSVRHEEAHILGPANDKIDVAICHITVCPFNPTVQLSHVIDGNSKPPQNTSALDHRRIGTQQGRVHCERTSASQGQVCARGKPTGRRQVTMLGPESSDGKDEDVKRSPSITGDMTTLDQHVRGRPHPLICALPPCIFHPSHGTHRLFGLAFDAVPTLSLQTNTPALSRQCRVVASHAANRDRPEVLRARDSYKKA